MSVTRRQLLAGAAAACAVMPARAQEANWPQRPIRIIIPTSPGGSPDIASRLIGAVMNGILATARPRMATTTVPPAKTTERPAVARERPTASSTSWPSA